jgi:hypothetical protein
MHRRTRFLLLPICGLLVAGSLWTAGAQYAIPWHTLDGGGGAGTGGIYTVCGTIGQPDANIQTGGSYCLAGGFWGFAGVLQTEGAPLLHITLVSQQSAYLSWSATVDGFRLQWRAALTEGDWNDEATTPVIVGDEYRVSVTPSAGARFYRLKKP